jgi:MFS superfamily sulfate permease-like transporter
MTSRGNAHLLRFNKDVTFFNKAELSRCLERVQTHHSLVIDATRCAYVDPDIAEALDDFARQAPGRSIDLEWRAGLRAGAGQRPLAGECAS